MVKKKVVAAVKTPKTRKPRTDCTPAIELPPADLLLTCPEAARHLRISVRQLKRLVRRKALKEISYNYGTKRYSLDDLNAFIASCRSNGSDKEAA